jgi:DNA polymerase-3 subunit beta
MSIALNYRYLIEPLRVMEDDSIAIKFTDSKKAISVVPADEKEYVHIIAPMQLD